MVEEEVDFVKGDSGSSHTFPIQCGTLHKGDYVMLKDHPCKLVEITTSKTGKHGHAKASIMGVDIFTKKKYEDSCPTSHAIDAPYVVRKEYQLADVNAEGYLTLLEEDGKTKEDLKLSEEVEDQVMLNKLRELVGAGKDILVGVIAAMGQERAIDYKEMA